jgi:hypothetical protein
MQRVRQSYRTIERLLTEAGIEGLPQPVPVGKQGKIAFTWT